MWDWHKFWICAAPSLLRSKRFPDLGCCKSKRMSREVLNKLKSHWISSWRLSSAGGGWGPPTPEEPLLAQGLIPTSSNTGTSSLKVERITIILESDFPWQVGNRISFLLLAHAWNLWPNSSLKCPGLWLSKNQHTESYLVVLINIKKKKCVPFI